MYSGHVYCLPLLPHPQQSCHLFKGQRQAGTASNTAAIINIMYLAESVGSSLSSNAIIGRHIPQCSMVLKQLLHFWDVPKVLMGLYYSAWHQSSCNLVKGLPWPAGKRHMCPTPRLLELAFSISWSNCKWHVSNYLHVKFYHMYWSSILIVILCRSLLFFFTFNRLWTSELRSLLAVGKTQVTQHEVDTWKTRSWMLAYTMVCEWWLFERNSSIMGSLLLLQRLSLLALLLNSWKINSLSKLHLTEPLWNTQYGTDCIMWHRENSKMKLIPVYSCVVVKEWFDCLSWQHCHITVRHSHARATTTSMILHAKQCTTQPWGTANVFALGSFSWRAKSAFSPQVSPLSNIKQGLKNVELPDGCWWIQSLNIWSRHAM